MTGNLRDSWRALEREHFSLWEFCLEGSFLGIQKDMGRRAQGTEITPQYYRGFVHWEL